MPMVPKGNATGLPIVTAEATSSYSLVKSNDLPFDRCNRIRVAYETRVCLA
jgi:hypothetical protein